MFVYIHLNTYMWHIWHIHMTCTYDIYIYMTYIHIYVWIICITYTYLKIYYILTYRYIGSYSGLQICWNFVSRGKNFSLNYPLLYRNQTSISMNQYFSGQVWSIYLWKEVVIKTKQKCYPLREFWYNSKVFRDEIFLLQ